MVADWLAAHVGASLVIVGAAQIDVIVGIVAFLQGAASCHATLPEVGDPVLV